MRQLAFSINEVIINQLKNKKYMYYTYKNLK